MPWVRAIVDVVGDIPLPANSGPVFRYKDELFSSRIDKDGPDIQPGYSGEVSILLVFEGVFQLGLAAGSKFELLTGSSVLIATGTVQSIEAE